MSSAIYLLEKLPHLKQLKLFFQPVDFSPDRYHLHLHDTFVEFERKDNKDEQKTSWDGVQAFNCYCARCETLLGISYKTVTESEEERLNEFHLWKFELATEGEFSVPFSRDVRARDSVFHWYCVENYFATKVLETKKARTVQKFLVYDDGYGVFVRLNLMSDKCCIKWSAANAELGQMVPALKLLFADVSHLTFELSVCSVECIEH